MKHVLIIGAGAIGAYLVRELHRMYPGAKLSCIERTELVESATKRLRDIAGGAVTVYDRVCAVPAGVELAVECGGDRKSVV